MILNLILLFVWFGVTVFDGLAWIYLWQAKEYRFDRFRAHWHTAEGKKELLPTTWVVKLGLFLAHCWLVDWFPIWLTVALVLTIFGIELIRFGFLFRHKLLRLPKWTAKARLLTAFVYLTQFGLMGWGLVGGQEVWWLVLATGLSLPLIILMGALFLRGPTELAKKRIVGRAKARLDQHKGLKIIGITGSFGKTSTKEFLVEFLKNKGEVFSTHERENTLIGIAGRINKGIPEQAKYFVAEMGAYQPGEIKKMCQLAPPQAAIVTILARQHLGLFGHFDRLVEAKMELAEAVGQKGLVVVNGDDDRLVMEVKKRGCQIRDFSLKNKKAWLSAQDIKVKPDRVSFNLVLGKKKQVIEAPLLGGQNVPNLLAASAMALTEGVSLSQLAKTSVKLKPFPGNMRPIKIKTKAWVVDDAYNANPEGVLAAVEYLKICPGEKWLILQPMIELGSASVSEHRRVLQEAVKVCDRILLTNANYWPELKKDFSTSDWAKLSLVRNRKEFEKLVGAARERNNTFLFEGKEAHKYLNYLVGHEV